MEQSVNQGANHDMWITKLKWKTANDEFKEMNELTLDCFRFVFAEEGLTHEQQALLINFMGDSDRLNSLTPVDFCNMFINRKIEFKLKFVYSKKCGLKHSYACFHVVRYLNKKLKLINDKAGKASNEK